MVHTVSSLPGVLWWHDVKIQIKIMLIRFFFIASLLIPLWVGAYPITSYLEMVKVTNVGNTWKTLPLENTYTNPVVACTYNLSASSSNEGSVRVEVIGSSVQVKVQRPLNSNAVTASDVYCTVSEEGSYTVPIKYEAHTVSSTQTNKKAQWQISRMVNVTASKVQNYTRPVVIGQVMSYNNPNHVVFWSSNCTRTASATNSAICVGKHVGETAITAPTTETLGYFIAEEAEYILPNAYVKIALGVDTIRGVLNSPPYNYSLPRSYSFATATISAMDGGDGGWAVLYGSNPVTNQLGLAIDEDTVGDPDRNHTSEQVAYWLMEPIVKTYADLKINEVMYNQSGAIKEFIEFSVLSNGTVLNYLVSSQDGQSQNYRLPDVNVTAGDYVIFYSGTGTNSSSGRVHHIYSQGSTAVLANSADDVLLLKPSSTDITTLNGNAGTHNVVPVDYMTYGTGGSIDPKPTSLNGVTVSWNSSQSGRLGGAAIGESVSLTPNNTDTDTSICWELSATTVASKKATSCPGYLGTRDTDPSAFKNSLGDDNTAKPVISLAKSVQTIYDPYNGASNPKAIPGSILEYIIEAKNDGNLAADNNSIKISDLIPANTRLCVSNVGSCKAPYFVDGSPSSGLSLAGTAYSNNNGASFTYSPVADGDGADSNVSNLRSSMNGAFQPKTGASAPNFQLKFRVIVE